jgi:hypothetical protein
MMKMFDIQSEYTRTWQTVSDSIRSIQTNAKNAKKENRKKSNFVPHISVAARRFGALQEQKPNRNIVDNKN